MLYTTLNKIREHSPCVDGWKKLLKHIGKTSSDDAPVGLNTILESNGMDDALWCLRAVDSTPDIEKATQDETLLAAAWDAAWAAARESQKTLFMQMLNSTGG